MLTRRRMVAALPAAGQAAIQTGAGKMELCLHQTTSAGSDFRQSVEGYARAGIRYVEVIPPMVERFGAAAARRLVTDLGMKAVSSGGVRGLAEPWPGRAEALEQLKKTLELAAGMGIDRMVCPCGTSGRFTEDDYRRGAENLRAAGEIAGPFGVTLMLEFMRGSTFVGTLPTSLRMTREAAHPNVKPMFDCYHFWAGLSKFEDLEGIRPGEIHHVHFQDVPEGPRELLDNGSREIPGTGVSPLVRILLQLKEKRYSGPLSVELFHPQLQQGDPYEVAARIRRHAEPVLRQAGVL